MNSTRCSNRGVRHSKSLTDKQPMPTYTTSYSIYQISSIPFNSTSRGGGTTSLASSWTRPTTPSDSEHRYPVQNVQQSTTNLSPISQPVWSAPNPKPFVAHASPTGTHMRRRRGKQKHPHRWIRRSVVLWAVWAGQLLRTSDNETDARLHPRHMCGKPCHWGIRPPRQNASHAHREWLDCSIYTSARRSASASCKIWHANQWCNSCHNRHEGDASNPTIPNNKR